jgi:hypothetical protein
MTSSPRAVPFLPDNHPYFEAYHFPAMARCDPDHHDSGWMNYQRSAAVRHAHRGEPSPTGAKIPVIGVYGSGLFGYFADVTELGQRTADFLDEEAGDPSWFVADAYDRERERLEAQTAAQLDGQLPAEVHLTLAGIPVAIATTIPTNHDLGFDREAD